MLAAESGCANTLPYLHHIPALLHASISKHNQGSDPAENLFEKRKKNYKIKSLVGSLLLTFHMHQYMGEAGMAKCEHPFSNQPGLSVQDDYGTMRLLNNKCM